MKIQIFVRNVREKNSFHSIEFWIDNRMAFGSCHEMNKIIFFLHFAMKDERIQNINKKFENFSSVIFYPYLMFILNMPPRAEIRKIVSSFARWLYCCVVHNNWISNQSIIHNSVSILPLSPSLWFWYFVCLFLFDLKKRRLIQNKSVMVLVFAILIFPWSWRLVFNHLRQHLSCTWMAFFDNNNFIKNRNSWHT